MFNFTRRLPQGECLLRLQRESIVDIVPKFKEGDGLDTMDGSILIVLWDGGWTKRVEVSEEFEDIVRWIAAYDERA